MSSCTDHQEQAKRHASHVCYESFTALEHTRFVVLPLDRICACFGSLTSIFLLFWTVQLKIDQRVFVTPSNRKIDVNIVSSNYHIELTLSDAGIYDRLVIQDILKEIAQTQNVDLNAKHRFKVVVINEADSLSRDAQSALRRTMEKYMANLRLVLCATSTSKIIAPIRSRCLLLRVGAPSDDEASIHSAREGLFASVRADTRVL